MFHKLFVSEECYLRFLLVSLFLKVRNATTPTVSVSSAVSCSSAIAPVESLSYVQRSAVKGIIPSLSAITVYEAFVVVTSRINVIPTQRGFL